MNKCKIVLLPWPLASFHRGDKSVISSSKCYWVIHYSPSECQQYLIEYFKHYFNSINLSFLCCFNGPRHDKMAYRLQNKRASTD